jgi:hypothetical protein
MIRQFPRDWAFRLVETRISVRHAGQYGVHIVAARSPAFIRG